MPLVVTLAVYSRAAHSHTSGVLMHRSSSRGICHARRGLVAVLSYGFAWARCSSRYSSRLAWSHRSLLTRLVWARCSHGIHHAGRGLVVLIGVVVAEPVHG